MSYCVSCGSPCETTSCSMCYGDIAHGTDGYYEKWAREQMSEDEARVDALEEETPNDRS